MLPFSRCENGNFLDLSSSQLEGTELVLEPSCKTEDFSSEEQQTCRIIMPRFRCWIEDGQGVLGVQVKI